MFLLQIFLKTSKETDGSLSSSTHPTNKLQQTFQIISICIFSFHFATIQSIQSQITFLDLKCSRTIKPTKTTRLKNEQNKSQRKSKENKPNKNQPKQPFPCFFSEKTYRKKCCTKLPTVRRASTTLPEGFKSGSVWLFDHPYMAMGQKRVPKKPYW